MSLSQRQHTTVVCRGGGLNQYQIVGRERTKRESQGTFSTSLRAASTHS
jgi:hypothetical protein